MTTVKELSLGDFDGIELGIQPAPSTKEFAQRIQDVWMQDVDPRGLTLHIFSRDEAMGAVCFSAWRKDGTGSLESVMLKGTSATREVIYAALMEFAESKLGFI